MQQALVVTLTVLVTFLFFFFKPGIAFSQFPFLANQNDFSKQWVPETTLKHWYGQDYQTPQLFLFTPEAAAMELNS